MSITPAEVENIAHLARLHLSPDEKREAAASITEILKLIDLMQSAATAEVQPLAHPFDAIQRLREDEVTEDDQREALQEIAPSTARGLYLVPRVIP